MKDKATTKRAHDELKPIIEFCAKHRGAISGIRDRMTVRTKKQWNRENVDRWLSSEPERWSQPLLGVGLILIEEAQAYMAEKAKENGAEK